MSGPFSAVQPRDGQSSSLDVLVVEDDATSRSLICRFLSERGLTVQALDGGETLMDTVRATGARVVVLDVNLPGENGFSLSRRLREREDVGIVMLSLRDSATDVLTGFQAGADHYLSKDTDYLILDAIIRNLLVRVAEKRRLIQLVADKGSPGGWSVGRETMQLALPDGGGITLTASEHRFMVRLAETPGVPVDRGTLVVAMGKRDTEQARRNLDALVRRLRQKVQQRAGLPLPVEAVYGTGYVYTGG
ncbi:response regulator transcription factor [Yunchengibacter salinarum]|uniref:response regulator transcription factor n=1 Tax=Yunchengibacter salinarum TaxID=3133399 RepID=UPI0035B68F57